MRYCIAAQWIYGLSTLIPIFVMFDGFSNYTLADNRTITFQWNHSSEFALFVIFLQWTPMTIIVVLLYIIIFANVIKKQVKSNNCPLFSSQRMYRPGFRVRGALGHKCNGGPPNGPPEANFFNFERRRQNFLDIFAAESKSLVFF